MRAPRAGSKAWLEAILGEPVLERRQLDPDYQRHTNRLWEVRTPTRRVVVRLPRRQAGRVAGSTAFWRGVGRLFGLRPGDVRRAAEAYRWLADLGCLPVPRPLAVGLGARAHLVVEWLPGRMAASLDGLGAALGEAVACLHARRAPGWGPPGRACQPAETFHPRLLESLRWLAGRGSPRAEPRLEEELKQAEAALGRLPPPAWMAPLLLDWDHSQLVAEDGRILGLVDLDALAVAPRELDLVGWELLLPAREAEAFRAAYRRRLPWPELGAVRRPYRLWLRCIEFQGPVPLEAWLAQPARFAAAGGS
ncbi:MAG: aminoglycoside phosphotransferase family protein [Firmicutes bacterium]|nr:aminoglycoside phosphotransferase family protein [Bacillota bacterium]